MSYFRDHDGSLSPPSSQERVISTGLTKESAAEGSINSDSTDCYHCGLPCRSGDPAIGKKMFCCPGCLAVYKILNDNRLDSYYQQAPTPGIRPVSVDLGRFAYLDSSEVIERLLSFSDNTRASTTLKIPAIHCVSCVWLLENLQRLHAGVLRSHANLATRTLTVLFDTHQLTLRGLVELLASLGYEPDIRLDALETQDAPKTSRRLHMQIGVAAFSFANIMLFSIPEYLSDGGIADGGISTTLRVASLVLALPVLLYAAQDYFRSAYHSLRQRRPNIDVPLALGILTLFVRSTYDIVLGLGIGYFDSFAGLVLLLLLGRLFQQKTFDRLSFDRDYRSYFPVSCMRKDRDSSTCIPLTSIHVGDRLIIRNGELIPADGILMDGQGHIDYSYVTGESVPLSISAGERVYAGGRQAGEAIEIEIIRIASESQLAALWDSPLMERSTQTAAYYSVADTVGKYFTAAVLTIAAATGVFWLLRDASVAMAAFTAVLIVACPCALALSRPFVLGTAVRIFGTNRLFLRNIDVVDELCDIEDIVFDKTGTLTQPTSEDVSFEGGELDAHERELVASLARNSTHPLSRQMSRAFAAETSRPITRFNEVAGVGVSGLVDGHEVRLGQHDWASFGDGIERPQTHTETQRTVFVGIDGSLRGRYHFESRMRDHIERTVSELKPHYRLAVLTGDTAGDSTRLRGLFGDDAELSANQSPFDKLEAIAAMTKSGCRVLMVGDGLNDAGALRSATVGLAVSEDTSAFSPASDGIIDADQLALLPTILSVTRKCRTLVKVSFGLSFLYNIVGLSFAVSGQLSPLVAAVLMPVSSISVVIFATVATRWLAHREGLTG